MKHANNLASTLTAAYAIVLLTGCGGDSPMSPSSMPQVVQGSVAVQGIDLVVVHFQVNRQGTLSSRVDWNDSGNDIDTGLLPGTCSVAQILIEVAGCGEADALAIDDGFDKPSRFTAPVAPGAHTLLVANVGPTPDTASYRLEIN